MFYKPQSGRIKDSFMICHEGRYYLFSMYSKAADREDYTNVWLAESDDGVHFTDVGAVIEAPFNVWAMSVTRIGDRFILNHGSFTRPWVQNVIRFWESTDLRHWRYMPELDLGPDTRYYHPDSRLDCMDVVPVEENGKVRYYGYATGPGGFLESDDGLHWSGMPPRKVDWDPIQPPPVPEDEGGFEIGGCECFNGKYYLVGGWFNYMGNVGYGSYTLVADSPRGPFRPDAGAYRLYGNSKRWIALWARFCRHAAEPLITTSYTYTGYSYESGETWMPPLKRAVVDAHGHLRMHYWPGNDAVKGAPLPLDVARARLVYPASPAADQPAPCQSEAGALTLIAGPERNSLSFTAAPWTVALSEAAFVPTEGMVLEAEIEVTSNDPRVVAPSIGFYLEEAPGQGTAILLDTVGTTRIGPVTLSDPPVFTCEDEVRPMCASNAGITPRVPHRFRLLIHRNMFELYLDDVHVQTFNTTHVPGTIGTVNGNFGWIVQNGRGVFRSVKAWRMNLGYK